MIQFSILENAFKLQNPRLLKRWIRNVISDEGYRVGMIQFIFCDQNYLLDVNKRFLGHTYYTDVITFPYSDGTSYIQGDIYIDVNTVLINANEFNASFIDEIHRVMIHGILHLLGYDDQTDDEATFIHHKEDLCLHFLKQLQYSTFAGEKVPIYRSECDKLSCQAAQAKPLKGSKRLSGAQKTRNQTRLQDLVKKK